MVPYSKKLCEHKFSQITNRHTRKKILAILSNYYKMESLLECNVQTGIPYTTSQADVICAMINNLEATIGQCDSDHFQHFKTEMKCFEKRGIETDGLFRKYKTSLLHCAVAAGSKEMVEELVKLGAGESNCRNNTYSLYGLFSLQNYRICIGSCSLLTPCMQCLPFSACSIEIFCCI